MAQPAIVVENLSKRYRIGRAVRNEGGFGGRLIGALRDHWRRIRMLGEGGDDDETIWALRDISFEVQRGEVIGFIGRNGAGKSTLLKILSRVVTPTTGSAVFDGRVGSLLEVGTGFHPELTGRENIYLNGAVLGMRRAEVTRRFDEIVEFSEIGRFLDTPVKRYSSGMYVRLAFAVAAHLDPEILIVDEVLAVGDLGFQKKCLARLGTARSEDRTVLLVSHNMQAITSTCDRVLWLQNGEMAQLGDAREVVAAYQADTRRAATRVGDRYVRSPARPEDRIRSLRILNDDGQSTTVFEAGEYINLIADLAPNLPTGAYFEWIVATTTGVNASAGHSLLGVEALRLPTPSGRVRVRIGPLSLGQGEYLITVRVGVQPGTVLDDWQDVDTLMISNRPAALANLPYETRRGITYTAAEYSDAGDWGESSESGASRSAELAASVPEGACHE